MAEPAFIAVELQSGPQRCVPYSDAGFECARDYVGAAYPVQIFPPSSPQRIVVHTLSDSNASDWVTETFTRIDIPFLAPEQESPNIFLSDRDARFLAQIGEDLGELSESVRLSASGKLCKQFTDSIGLNLANIPQIRCAVFGDEEDGITLVAHSRASMRQVSFEFGDDENTINIVSIDEQMRRFERACGIDQTLTLVEAIAWLNPR
jgi:hypothetical protein